MTYFENDNFTIVNLEGALCDEGNPMQKKHVFRGPTAYVNILTQNSVEAVTIANNHSMDYGPKGYATTQTTLEAAGIPYVERDSSTLITTDSGLTIGLYGAVYYYLDVEDMTREIAALREQGRRKENKGDRAKLGTRYQSGFCRGLRTGNRGGEEYSRWSGGR